MITEQQLIDAGYYRVICRGSLWYTGSGRIHKRICSGGRSPGNDSCPYCGAPSTDGVHRDGPGEYISKVYECGVTTSYGADYTILETSEMTSTCMVALYHVQHEGDDII